MGCRKSSISQPYRFCLDGFKMFYSFSIIAVINIYIYKNKRLMIPPAGDILL